MIYILKNIFNIRQIKLDIPDLTAIIPHAVTQVTPTIPTRPPRFLETSEVFKIGGQQNPANSTLPAKNGEASQVFWFS